MSWYSSTSASTNSLCLALAVGAALCLALAAAAAHSAWQQQQQQAQQQPRDAEEAACMSFLRAHMPERDRGAVSDAVLLQHVRLALAARHAHTWAADVPWQVFLNDVLPYVNLDEPRDDVAAWRPMFAARFAPLVARARSLTEAAQTLNREVWGIWGIHFKPDLTPEIMSVSQVLAAGYASCTGLSIFLVNACRAVGVPARVAGTPSWVQDRRDSPHERFNNHNWVEVWDGQAWSFTGACEYNAQGLNRTWFFPQPAKGQRPGSHWHAIYAASYQNTGLSFPLAWAPKDASVPGVDVTQAYVDAAVPAGSSGSDDAAGTAAAAGAGTDAAAGAAAADAAAAVATSVS